VVPTWFLVPPAQAVGVPCIRNRHSIAEGMILNRQALVGGCVNNVGALAASFYGPPTLGVENPSLHGAV